ncbi:putative flavin carrier protein 3 [Cyberlindnera fabianii]|nr:putative flavin carrier protein 3 [Cyberlindnera fabianii]
MENSLLSASYFDVVFDPDDGSLHYTLDFTSEVSDYIIADVDIYAYGFKIISRQIDLCDLDWKQFCPLYPGQVEIDSIEYIDDSYTSQIPGIAYTVPDIDAFARIKIRNTNGTSLGCIQAFFTNGKTVSQTGVKWATAVIAGLGLLVAGVTSAFGNSNAASHVSANAVSLFLYFQSVVVITMQHVDQVPPIASAWAENLAWSMGLIKVSFMQKIFRWYVQATGGTPSLYLTSSTINILTQRSWEYASDLAARGYEIVKRSKPLVLYGNSNVLIFRGIKRIAYQANIENTSVVCTGFTFFILCAYVLVAVLFVLKYGSEVCIRAGWMKSARFYDLRQNWKAIIKGALSRYILIGFTQLVLLALWEFVQKDSPAVIVLAVLFLILAIGVLGWTSFRVHHFAKQSLQQHKNPAAVLYGNQQILDKYGFFYTMFNANKYWWGNVLLLHTFVKCIFIALCQASGKTQAMVFWIIDMVYLGLLIHFKPYLNTPTNIVNILIQLVTTLNSFMFTFFSNIFGQPAAVSSIMGWVFFILNAAFSLILLILILVLCAYVAFSKNPDARFKPATDDRTSFQRFSHNGGQKGPTAELLALGLAAKDHNENWETEIHKMQDMSKSTENSSNDVVDEDKTVPIEDDEKETFAGKIVRKLTKGRSTKRSKSQNQGKRLLSDVSYRGDNDDTIDGAEYTFEQSHKKDASVASFHHAAGRPEQETNDFIGSSNGRQSTNLDDQVNYSKF